MGLLLWFSPWLKNLQASNALYKIKGFCFSLISKICAFQLVKKKIDEIGAGSNICGSSETC